MLMTKTILMMKTKTSERDLWKERSGMRNASNHVYCMTSGPNRDDNLPSQRVKWVGVAVWSALRVRVRAVLLGRGSREGLRRPLHPA